jgi:small Trp-rich protein
MFFILLGVLLTALKVLEIGPVATWSWWAVVAPYGVAVAWWSFADATGRTARAQADKTEQRTLERRRRNLEAMGFSDKRRR